MLMASWITAGFIIFSISAYYELKKIHLNFARKCFNVTLFALSVLVLSQAFVGDTVGYEIHRDQPLKTAAMEGVWHTERGAPLILFALPDDEAETNYWTISIPHLGSVLNTHEWNGEMIGLDTVPKADRPFVPFPFFSFRIMVGLAALMLGVLALGIFLYWRKKLYDAHWYHRLCIASAPLGFLALWFGWITAETGRQPWAVYNMIRTNDAVSHVDLNHVIISLVLIFIVYGIIFGYFYFKYLFKIIAAGPTQNPISTDQPFAYMRNEAERK
jgi:cytochrome d ubiquinol oxidase subunit I